jgi:hypothetical protein
MIYKLLNNNSLKSFIPKIQNNIFMMIFNFLLLIYFIASQYYIYKLFYVLKTFDKDIYLYVCLLNFILFLIFFITWNVFKFKYKYFFLKCILVISFTFLYTETYFELEKLLTKYSDDFSILKNQIFHPIDDYNSTIAKLKLEKIEAFPEIASYRLLVEEKKKKYNYPLLPLGGIANKTAVMSKTSGAYTYLEMDEHGFNNKKNLYLEGEVEVVLVGACMWEEAGLQNPYEENIGQLLRNENIWALNFSKAGNSPITQYAIIKEYAEIFKPKAVLFVVDRDTSNFSFNNKESLGYDNKILKKYLSDINYSQNLLNRQDAIDLFWYDFFKKNTDFIKNTNNQSNNNFWIVTEKIINILKLSNLRINLNINLNPLKYFDSIKNKDSFDTLETILVKSKNLTESWGGKFYIVYQPHKNHFDPNEPKPYMDFVNKFAKKYNVKLINFYEEVVRNHPDKLSLLPDRIDPHFNAYANELFANVIIKHLKNDKIKEK